MKHFPGNNLQSLRLHWILYALGSFVAVYPLAISLANSQGVAYGLQWTLQSSAIMLIQLISLWRALPLNHRPEEQNVLPRFGPGNWLSLWRGTIIALLSGFLFRALPTGFWVWIPFLLYLISDVTDFLDGYLARATNTVTTLGKTLDMNNDALGVLVATALAFQYGSVPWWYLPFGFARYAFLLGLYFHRRKGLPEYPLNPNNTRRLFAGIQMGFITVMLIPVLQPPATTFAATLFLVPFLGMFVLDYWQVIGQQPKLVLWGKQNQALLGVIFIEWLPLILRGLAVMGFLWQIFTLRGILPMKLISAPPPNLVIFLFLDILFLLMMALGAISRVTAIAALISIGFQTQWLAFGPDIALLILPLTYVLFAGSGKFSFGNPEEWLIHNRPGQKPAS